MPIIRQTNIVYTLLNATVMDTGCLNVSFDVTVEGISNFTTVLTIPQNATTVIMDSTIADGSTIRDTLTAKIYEYFVSTGEIVGDITA